MIDDNQAIENVAANVTYLLDRLGWKQKNLAQAIRLPGESQEAANMKVSRICNGKQSATAATLSRIAEALSTSVDFLLSTPREKIAS